MRLSLNHLSAYSVLEFEYDVLTFLSCIEEEEEERILGPGFLLIRFLSSSHVYGNHSFFPCVCRPTGTCSIFSVGDVGHLDNADALTYGHYHGYSMARKLSRL